MRLLSLAATAAFVGLSTGVFAQDGPASQPAKVCVAVVGNASTTSAFLEHLTERLVKSLKQNKVGAVAMDSSTSSRYPLQLSKENGHESQQKNCDYVLLTQIRDPRQHPLDPASRRFRLAAVFLAWTRAIPWGARAVLCTGRIWK
jgi:hypothetical protein